MPHTSTIRKWYANASVGNTSGITEEAMNHLSNIANEMKSKGKQLLLSLVWDEMSHRKHIQWSDSQKKFLGFADTGKKTEAEERPVAKQALVFMVNGLNYSFSLPCAYYFINRLDAFDKRDLLIKIVTAITATGARTVNVTFDGLASNLKMCRLLGASFKTDDLRNYFYSPVDQTKIYIMLDACHMLKLMRNCIGEKNVYDDKNRVISWRFFEELEKFRISKKFVTHKITKKHIMWNKNKMNVPLAAQTLSNSVANAMTYLKNKGIDQFKNAEGTIEFIKNIDKLFDVLNSKNPHDNVYKSPIKYDSLNEIMDFCNQVKSYILGLKIDGLPILQSPKKCGFKGMLLNIVSLQDICKEYVTDEAMNHFELRTFYLSQDPLESLFGRIRSILGDNDNPTVEQFMAGYRRQFVENEIKSSLKSNCLDQLTIFNISSTKRNTVIDESKMNEDRRIVTLLYQKKTENKSFDDLEIASIAHEAWNIENKIKSIGFECAECKTVFDDNDKFQITETKNVCNSTIEICKITSIFVEILQSEPNLNYTILLEKLLLEQHFDKLYENTDFTHDPADKSYIIRFVAEEFFRTRAVYIAKNATLQCQTEFLRKKLLKLLHFFGQ